MNLAGASDPFPGELHDWEVMLTRTLLRSDAGDGDAIRSFEITPETLAEFCGFGQEHGARAEAAFRQALVADPYLLWRLEHGRRCAPGDETPGCIAILALSLLVDSLLDGDYSGNGEYRTKLRQWLGVNRSFMNLRGLALMWEELAKWLEGRVADGAPFRRLILPTPPPSWTHIGYTRYLSFPARRDLRFLQKQLERGDATVNDPAALVRLLDPLVALSDVSIGLREAFQDFRRAFRAGEASLHHRFWRLVERAGAMTGEIPAQPAELRMEYDEDRRRHFRIGTLGAATLSNMTSMGEAAICAVIAESPNLGPNVRRGMVLFSSSGLASWSAVSQFRPMAGPFHMAIADRYGRVAEKFALFERSGEWSVSVEPLKPATVSEIVDRLGLQHVSESVHAVGVVDGIRVGKAWLGAARFLPSLTGINGEVEVRPVEAGTEGALSCVDGRLRADGAVDGEFVVADEEGTWSRRVAFTAQAKVHPDLRGSAYRLDEVCEWRSRTTSAAGRIQAYDLAWSEDRYGFQDVIEAIYARGRSGLDEGDAIAIIDRAAGEESWEFLRTLQEATFLDARFRSRWRGRIFTLAEPCLEIVKIGGAAAVVVSGAIPARLEADFRDTVDLQGGRPFRRVSRTGLGPPLFGATSVDPSVLGAALGWRVKSTGEVPDGSAPAQLISTALIGEGYEAVSGWDWTRGRFRLKSIGMEGVSLIRLVHPGSRDHDIYRVTGRTTRKFVSRQAAILDAYAQAGLPLFSYGEGALNRLAAEGSLPLEVARALRLRTLVNGGLAQDGWRYQVGEDEARWMANLLPGLIAGVREGDLNGQFLGSRRGRSLRRPVWMNGGIQT
ncbi:hypothetical protein [Rhizobium azibense]|uniref:Uncharacterized protein n=1 Tax=Rhizobium azibense TaxID=1136135 RepID=A0A4R3RDP0_9HYPH|nr:hypothetical protein [Rhizobium azibense]TCU33638.1 hypothetical protein EV129_115145 [Rhizobium azibense]